jgi:hypothetical protein
MTATCRECEEPLPQREPGTPGRERLYCSARCKDRAKARRLRRQAAQFRAFRRELMESR